MTDPELFQILYISSGAQAVRPDELEDILAVSRRRNSEAHVSGALLVRQNRFLQALEGPKSAVELTYSRIVADRRHYAVVRLNARPICARQFGTWAMACDRSGSAFGNEPFEAAVRKITAALTNRTLKAELEGFANVRA